MPGPVGRENSENTPPVSSAVNNFTPNACLAAVAPSDVHKSMMTPVKCMGQLYNSQQYCTPSTRTQAWGALPQSSPCLRTPGSMQSAKGASRLCTPASISNKKCTPNSVPKNPFDGSLLDRLGGPVFSPNVFAQCSSAEQTPKSFKWTVDEIAMIKPAEIEEMPHQDNIGSQTDQDLEKRAQDTIDAYFAQNLIVPSPWTNSSKKNANFYLPRTPKTPAGYDSPMVFSERKTPAVDKVKPVTPKNDVVCQTTLTLPPDVDLAKILGEFYTYKPSCEGGDTSPQDLSSSSLRRKLFFHGEEGTAPSPVKSNKNSASKDYNSSPTVSPIKYNTPKQKHKPSPLFTPESTQFSSPILTPGSAQFSSSPISGPRSMKCLTPSLRRCSTEPSLMESPGLSPIGSNNQIQGLHAMTPLCRPLQASPSSGQLLHALDSPGMSPIVSGMSPVIPMDGSYMDTPQIDRRTIPIDLFTDDSPDIHPNQDADPCLQRMDVEVNEGEDVSFSPQNIHQFTGAQGRLDLETRYSSDESSDQDTPQQIYFVSQVSHDTGYNTNSLQLTTTTHDAGQQSMIGAPQESGALHTNLTQQFGSLPFSHQDTGVDFDDSSQQMEAQDFTEHGSRMKKTIVRHVSSKNTPGVGTEPVSDCDVIRRARCILGKSTSMDDSQLYTTETSKPKLINTIGVSAFPLVAPRQGKAPSGDGHRQLSGQTKMLPSELAKQVLHRAGRDLLKYGSSWTGSTDDLSCGLPGDDSHLHDDDYYLVMPPDSDKVQGSRVSLSAEF